MVRWLRIGFELIVDIFCAVLAIAGVVSLVVGFALLAVAIGTQERMEG